MSFSPNVRKAFQSWIKVSSWHTGHTADDKRFYGFVWSVLTYSRKRPSEGELRQEIMKAWSGRLESKYLQERASEYAQLYEHLHGFAKAKNIWRVWP